MKEQIIALVQARGGSKGVPGKNIRNLKGFPLIAWSIACCKLSRKIDRVILSTDSEKIAEIGKKFGAEVPFIRPSEFAMDDSTDYVVIKHFLDWMNENEKSIPKYVVQIRPTTPLRDPDQIDEAIELISASASASGLRSVYEMSETAWKTFELEESYIKSILSKTNNQNENLSSDMPRQALPKTYVGQGLVDVINPIFCTEKNIYGENVLGFVSPNVGEIDTEDDFDFINYLIEKKQFGKKILDFLIRSQHV